MAQPIVLFTASTWSHISNFHRPYLRAFRDLGWQVYVACGGEARDIPEADLCVQLPFEKSMTSPMNFTAQSKLRKLMKEHQYTLVCTHTSLAAFFTRRAAAGVKPRPAVVNMAHGYLFDRKTPFRKRRTLLAAEKVTASVTDLLLTMNQWDYEIAKKHKLGKRIENIPGVGVDFSRFSPVSPEERAALRAAHGIGPDDFLLVFAGEFSARKNQPALIRCMPKLPENVKLALPGAGAGLNSCRIQVQALKLDDRVIIPGHVPMNDWYAMADAAVSSSRSEGLPFNIMEAMYCGLPVVATDVKGHQDLVEVGKTGLLFPFDKDKAFVAAVQQLLDNPDQTAAMGIEAQKRVEQYRLEKVLPQVMELYLSTLEK